MKWYVYLAPQTHTSLTIPLIPKFSKSVDNQQITVLTLLDFSNAFHTIDFDILLAVLSSLNILVSPEVIGWFRSYLHGRRQHVRVQDSFSSWSVVRAGVSQGAVLSPLVFHFHSFDLLPHYFSLLPVCRRFTNLFTV